METQAGEQTPTLRILFPCAVKMAGVQLKDGVHLVGLYAYRLRGGGHWKLETAVLGRQGVVKGLLVRHTVMPITRVTRWGDRLEAHMDHPWLMMRSHAQGETWVHSGELGVVEVGGGVATTTGGMTTPTRAAVRVPRGSKGKGVGQPRKAPGMAPPTPSPLSPLSPSLPKR